LIFYFVYITYSKQAVRLQYCSQQNRLSFFLLSKIYSLITGFFIEAKFIPQVKTLDISKFMQNFILLGAAGCMEL